MRRATGVCDLFAGTWYLAKNRILMAKRGLAGFWPLYGKADISPLENSLFLLHSFLKFFSGKSTTFSMAPLFSYNIRIDELQYL
jgi:hypothetical protein